MKSTNMDTMVKVATENRKDHREADEKSKQSFVESLIEDKIALMKENLILRAVLIGGAVGCAVCFVCAVITGAL